MCCLFYVIVCYSLTFGDNCKKRCPCNGPTTVSCDKDTGKCLCKTNYSGPTCSCVDKFAICNTTISDCYYGTYKPGTCICKKVYTNYENGCKGMKFFFLVILFRFYFLKKVICLSLYFISFFRTEENHIAFDRRYI